MLLELCSFCCQNDITGLWKQSFELIFDSLQSREIVLFYFWENLINVIFKNCFLGLEIDLISTQWTSPFFFALPLLRGHPSIIHTGGLSLFWKRWPQESQIESDNWWNTFKHTCYYHIILNSHDSMSIRLYYTCATITSLRAYFYMNKLTLLCFVPIPDKLLLRGKPLLSSHLPFCRGWQINKGSIAVKISSWLNCRTNNIPLQWVEVLCTDSHWKALLHLSKLFGKHGKYSCEIRQCYLFINFIS